MGANTKNEEKKDEINFVKEFELDGVKFTVKLCEGKDLEKFMEENQSHLDLIVNKERNKKLKKKNKTILETPVKLSLNDDRYRLIIIANETLVYLQMTDKNNAIKDIKKIYKRFS